MGFKRIGNCDTHITIKMSKDMKDRIKKQAEELGMPVSLLIRSILEQYFK